MRDCDRVQPGRSRLALVGPAAGAAVRAAASGRPPVADLDQVRFSARWTGTITVGWKPDGRRDRITVRSKSKTEVKDKLRTKHLEFAAGVRTPTNYTVEQCLKD
jgi:hypothetical protein